MRIDPDDFDDETVSREVYGNVMVVLLLLTTVPAVSALMYRSPTERSLALLKQAANSEGGSHLATKRRELRKLRPETAEVHQDTEDQLEDLQQQPELLEDSQQSQWGQEDEREREPHTELEPIPEREPEPQPQPQPQPEPQPQPVQADKLLSQRLSTEFQRHRSAASQTELKIASLQSKIQHLEEEISQLRNGSDASDLGPEPEEKHDSDPQSTVNLLPRTNP